MWRAHPSHLHVPVSPLVAMFSPAAVQGNEDAAPEDNGDDEDEVAMQDDAVFDDLIIGEHEGDSDVETEDAKNVKSQDGADHLLCLPCADQEKLDHSPTGLPCPPEFTSLKEWNKHCLTHLPYHAGCPFCVAGKRNNSPHRRSHTVRRLPHISCDYGFLRDSTTDDLVTFAVVRVKPYKLFFATVIDLKGPDPHIVQRLSRWIRECGLVHFTFRSDREPAVRSLLWEAIKSAGLEKHATEEPMTAVPEESSHGESQSNGEAERAIQFVDDQTRTSKLALESVSGERSLAATPSCDGC